MHLACLKNFFVEKNITVIEAHSITKEAFENVDYELEAMLQSFMKEKKVIKLYIK